jgi:DNA invertase Pin-like site-specific DNA recombinase
MWGEAAVLFLAPLAVGLALVLLGGPGWATLGYVAFGTVLAIGRLGVALLWTSRPHELPAEAPASSPAEAPASSPAEALASSPAEAPASSPQPAALDVTPAEPSRPAERRAVGYVYLPPDAGASELDAHSDEIRRWTEEHGLRLVSIVHDMERGQADIRTRPALRGALERIAAGDADALVTARLDHLAPTVAGLPPLVRWLTASSRSLIAIDLRLDTATESGRLAAVTLTAIGGWEHERLAARTRRGLAAARARGARGGQAAVADRPELQDRIRRMREQGMTLQAIADALNEEGVPTLRGGAKWRPSSVQRAAGYRRPPSRQPSIDLP